MRFLLKIMTEALLLLVLSCERQQSIGSRSPDAGRLRMFQVTGVVEQVTGENRTVVVKHDAVPDYMPAMTMPFKVKDPKLTADLHTGDGITFRLQVAENESWIDQITQTHIVSSPATQAIATAGPPKTPSFHITEIPDFALTNELGNPVSLGQFHGEAVAVTFFFTRCPIPEYCPRLSRNFAEASQKLAALKNGPTNWHFLSISFDPLDTPGVLRGYAQQYRYDSNHWTFLTGDSAHIRALTRGFGLSVTPDSGVFVHDFRTIVFDATGRLQTMWPFGGDTTDLLVRELTQAAAAKP